MVKEKTKGPSPLEVMAKQELAALAMAYTSSKDQLRYSLAAEDYIGGLFKGNYQSAMREFIQTDKKASEVVKSGSKLYEEARAKLTIEQFSGLLGKVFSGDELKVLDSIKDHKISDYLSAYEAYSSAEEAYEEAGKTKDTAASAKAIADMKKYENGSTIYLTLVAMDSSRIKIAHGPKIEKRVIGQGLQGLEKIIGNPKKKKK
jgi:hypothetical protein